MHLQSCTEDDDQKIKDFMGHYERSISITEL